MNEYGSHTLRRKLLRAHTNHLPEPRSSGHGTVVGVREAVPCVVLWALVGCISATEADGPPQSRYQLFVSVTEQGTAEAWLLEAGASSVSRYAEGGSLWILGYADTAVLPQLGVAGPGPVPLAPAGATTRDSWPLPTPRAARHHRYAHDAVVSRDVASDELVTLPALASVRLPRAPCPTLTVERVAVPRNLNATMLLPLGPGGNLVLGGRIYRPEDPGGVQSAAVYRVHDGAVSELPGFAFVGTSASALLLKPPRGYVRDGRAHVVWRRGPAERYAPELHVLTSTGGTAWLASLAGELDPQRFTPVSMAARGDVSAAYVTHDEVRHDVLTRRGDAGWTFALDTPTSGKCDRNASLTYVLEFVDERTLLIGRRGDFVRELDLTTGRSTLAISDADGYCLNSYARTDSGAEFLFATTNSDDVPGRRRVNYWRPSRSDPWTAFAYHNETLAEGSGSIGVGELVLVNRGADGHRLDVLEYDRLRAELGPRLCASLDVGAELRHFVREGDVVYAAGSEGAHLVVLRVNR